MKGALVENYKDPALRALARSVLTNFLLENKKLPFLVAFDSSTIHFKPWFSIVFNPRVRSAWKAILERYYETDEYKKLNNAVAGDELLSKYATVNFLNTFFKKLRDLRDRIPRAKAGKRDGGEIQGLLKGLDTQVSRSPREAERNIATVIQALKNEAEETLKDIQAIQSFSHLGLPCQQFLDKPEDLRKKLRDRIVVSLVKFLSRLRKEAPSARQARMPTLVGGRPLGVKRIQRWSELVRILPMELLDDDLLAYRVASRTLRVSEQYGSIQNYVIYIDKSGSMRDSIRHYTSPTQYESVPKISFATACALALALKLRRLGARLTLKFFDTDVHDPVSDFETLIDELLRIEAWGGTNISNVLDDAVENHREERIIVVTDGIDEVSEDSVKNAKSRNLDIEFVFIRTNNALLRKNFPCVHLEHAKPEVILSL